MKFRLTTKCVWIKKTNIFFFIILKLIFDNICTRSSISYRRTIFAHLYIYEMSRVQIQFGKCTFHMFTFFSTRTWQCKYKLLFISFLSKKIKERWYCLSVGVLKYHKHWINPFYLSCDLHFNCDVITMGLIILHYE